MYQNGSQKCLFQYGNLRATEKAVYFRELIESAITGIQFDNK